ncbi:hypothetical protein Nepgr_004440 [Nepenthes gracilis]|uniref:Pectinesterase inhibitor domain-containing protein n=1 Tax=Nepenthes gracilis TaxID=150966 RepID=A0AAD3S1U0_NEPGR|nr:hypothetical protein Nepgr_004440 [Nepenthes gracilis]
MERVSSLFLFIIPLAFCFATTFAVHTTGGLSAQHSAKPTAGAEALIKQACQKALYKEFCVSTLKARPEAKNIDLKGLAFLTMKVAKEQGNATAAFIDTKLKNEESLAPGLDQALNDCREQYDDALAQIEDSMQAFLANAANDVNTWLSAAMTNADTCEEGLNDAGVGGAMGDRNQVFVKLCSNALAVTNAWAQRH